MMDTQTMDGQKNKVFCSVLFAPKKLVWHSYFGEHVTSAFRRKRRDSMVYHDVPDSDYLIELTIKVTQRLKKPARIWVLIAFGI